LAGLPPAFFPAWASGFGAVLSLLMKGSVFDSVERRVGKSCALGASGGAAGSASGTLPGATRSPNSIGRRCGEAGVARARQIARGEVLASVRHIAGNGDGERLEVDVLLLVAQL